jgi:pyruvate kinase
LALAGDKRWRTGADQLTVRITRARERGVRLQADKGINLPDSDLSLGALTEKDVRDLTFIVEHADLVAYSFVRRAKDVHRLQNELARLGRPDMGIVLKIENRQAFQQLPRVSAPNASC